MRLTRRVSSLLLIGVLAGCGSDRDDGATTQDTAPSIGDAAEPTQDPATSTKDTAPTPEDAASRPRCDAGEDAEWLDLMDRGEPDAFLLGEGSAAVILLHQNDGRACAWVPFAEQLVDQGYAVLVPVMESGTWPQPVIARGAEHLRAGGSDRLALVGASMGGTYAIAALPDLADPPDAVVAVSAPDYYRGASARDVIADQALPIVLIAAQEDAGFAAEAEALAEAASDAELVVLPGYAHGIRLLQQDPEANRAVVDALGEHVPAGGPVD